MTDQPKELPDNLPPLPPAPKGMRWEYRGTGFHKPAPSGDWLAYIYSGSMWRTSDGDACGDKGCHYAELVSIPFVDWQARAESLEAALRAEQDARDAQDSWDDWCALQPTMELNLWSSTNRELHGAYLLARKRADELRKQALGESGVGE